MNITNIWAAPSTRSCFKNSAPYIDDTNTFTLDAAKGESVSVQIMIKNGADIKSTQDAANKTLRVTDATVTQLSGAKFDAESIKIQAQEYISFADGIAYPDPISNGASSEIPANCSASWWVTFIVPESQDIGEYKFRVTLNSNVETDLFAEITLKVYNVTIPKPSDALYNIEHFTNPEDGVMFETNGYTFRPFDDEWWEFVEKYAKSLRECRSNVYRLYPLHLLKGAGSKRISKDKWHLDFSVFDRLVKILTESGAVKRFSIDDFLTPLDGTEIFSLDENGDIVKIPKSKPEAEIWLECYLTSLYNHAKELGIADNLIMHIQDEPHNPETWLWGKSLVKKYMPGIKCGNPIGKNIAELLGDEVDLYIPDFGAAELELDFYREASKKSGKEVWPYCCCIPYKSWFLQRFIDTPLVRSRLIGWATYSRGFTGFLHYGYSYWQRTEQFYPYSTEMYSAHKGDCMLIYPSPEDNSYKISARYINIRDGAQDYELLKIAEKYDKVKAKELSNSIAAGYTEFTEDEKMLVNARRELLKLAESAVENT